MGIYIYNLLCQYIYIYFNLNNSINEILRFCVEILPDIFMIRFLGLSTWRVLINRFTWTIHCMLFVELVIWYFLKNNKQCFSEFIVPVSIIICLGLWAHYGNAWYGIIRFDVLRVWVAYCVGYESLFLSKKVAVIPFNRLGQIAFTIITYLGHCVIMLGMYLNISFLEYRWLVSYLEFGLLIAFSLSGHDQLNVWINKNKVKKKICTFLGELSLSVYLMQCFVFDCFERFYPNIETRYKLEVKFFIILISCAFIQKWFVPILIKAIGNTKKFVIMCLINHEDINKV